MANQEKSGESPTADVERNGASADAPQPGESELRSEAGDPPIEKSADKASAAGGGMIDHDAYAALQQELEQALAKGDENWNQFLRAKAEMENQRRRFERDLENAHKYGLEKFARELLGVRDSLEMGVAAAREGAADAGKLLEGKELTLKMLSAAFEKFGVKDVNPIGDRFNPDLHEAMATQPSSEVEPNTVMQVIQKGYLLNDRVIRPAMVIVSRAAEETGG